MGLKARKITLKNKCRGITNTGYISGYSTFGTFTFIGTKMLKIAIEVNFKLNNN